MKKTIFGRISCFVFAIALIFVFVPSFVGCSFDDTVKKASKKLNSYAISATLSEDGKQVTATEQVKIEAKNNALPELWFHLYGRAFREGSRILPYSTTSTAKCFPNGVSFGNMEVLSVEVDGELAKFSYGGQDQNILIVEKSLKKGEKTTLEIEFVLSLCETTHRLGYFEDNVNLGNWYPVLCVFENGEFVADPYYSVGDPFYSECANYDVQFEYPAKFEIGSTGKIVKQTQNNQFVKAQIEANAVRDFALVFSTKFESKKKKVGETTVEYLGYAGDSDLDKNLETAALALATFNKLFGQYPYRTLTVAKTPFLFGGMEYPNLVWIADNISDDVEKAKVIAHEIAHQWWYGLVGNNEVSDSYIDEAMAEYSTVLFFEKNDVYGYSGKQMVEDAATSYELYEEVIDSIKGTVNDTLNQKTTDFVSEYEYVYVVYVKGTLFLDALRDKVGDKDFLNALKAYCKKHKFKNATRNDFLSAFSKANGDDISDFFGEWKA